MRRLLDPWVVIVVALASALPMIGFSYRFRFELLGHVTFLPLAVGTLVVQVAILAVVAWRRPQADVRRVAFALATVVLACASFQSWTALVAPGLSDLARLPVWAAMTALATWGVWRFAPRPWFRWGSTIFVSVLVVGQAVSLASYRVWLAGAVAPAVDADLPALQQRPAERPDVWWFVLDMMGRPDQVRSRTGADLTPFVDALADDGFVVADDSWASYPRTSLSVSSTLAMGYPFLPGMDLRNEFAAGVPLLLDRNPTFDRFRQAGYQVGYAPAGAPHWTHCGSGPDICVEPSGDLLAGDDLRVAMAELTPLGAFDVVDAVHSPPSDAHARLAAARDRTQPLFAFVHVLAPHGPARYAADCSPLDRSVSVFGAAQDARTEHYATDITCIAADMQRTVDAILAEDPDAVIVIQGDHGTKLDETWDPPLAWSDDEYVERYATFNALRLPPTCPLDDPRSFAVVNTFRVVFGCLEGRPADLADYRAFNWTYGEIDTMVELDPRRGPLGPSG